MTPLVSALHVGLIALALASVGEARRPDAPTSQETPAIDRSTAASGAVEGRVAMPVGAGALAPA
ncbi:MAG TPA: hypothetical protein VHM48_00140 [Candidatus Limnocylindrales bacterium]|nr:hypothetical protein [Candidatus Limnocylindrales bacterium]